MAVSPFDDPILSGLVGDDDVALLFTTSATVSAMVRFELALSRASAAEGFIPETAIAPLEHACATFRPDIDALRAGTMRDGVVVPDLVRQLRAAVGEPSSAFVHKGASSQDVIDTALTLRLVDVATISYVADRTTFDRRARATSVMELTWAGALIVIAPLAGLLAARTSWRVPLLLLGAVSALSAVAMRRWLDADGDRPARRAARPPRWTAPERWLLLTAALVFAVLEATFAVFGLWLEADFGVGIEGLGVFAAVTAAGELVGSATVLVVADRVGKHRTAWAGLGLASLGLASLLLAPNIGLAVAAMAVGLCGSEMAIVSVVPLGSEVQPASRSRFLAAMMSAASVTRAVVAAGGAALFAMAGIGANVAISILAALIAATLLRHVLRLDPRLRSGV